MFYAYVLESEKDGRYYYGSTEDVSSRINRHNSGKVISTRNRRPFKLIGYITFETRLEALRQEKKFKEYKNKSYVLSKLKLYGAIV